MWPPTCVCKPLSHDARTGNTRATNLPAIKNAVGFVYPRDVIGSFTPRLANDVPDKLLHGPVGEFRGCFVLMWLRTGDFVTHKIQIQRMVCYTRDKEPSGWEHKQKEMTMSIQPVKAVQIPPPSPAPCRLPSSTTQLKLNPRVFNQSKHIQILPHLKPRYTQCNLPQIKRMFPLN